MEFFMSSTSNDTPLSSIRQRATDDEVTIDRTTPDANFTIVPNDLIRDPQLTYFERGLLIEILSNCADWRVTALGLWERTRKADRKDAGREQFLKAFKNLERCGYLTRHRSQNDDGTWKTRLHFYAMPIPADARTGSGGSPTYGNPVVGNRVVNHKTIEEESHGQSANEAPVPSPHGLAVDSHAGRVDHAGKVNPSSFAYDQAKRVTSAWKKDFPGKKAPDCKPTAVLITRCMEKFDLTQSELTTCLFAWWNDAVRKRDKLNNPAGVFTRQLPDYCQRLVDED